MSEQAPIGLAQRPGQQVSWISVAADQAAWLIARDVAARLHQAIEVRGRAVLHVSGGKSPVALFHALQKQALDWSRVHVSLADERCVPVGHADSNATLVRTHLLQGPAAQARFSSLVPDSVASLPPPAAMAELASRALQAQGVADVLILGMGLDGHIASIFPGMSNLSQALEPIGGQVCLAVELAQPPEQAPYPRLTQSLAHMLKARHIVLPVSGAQKQAVLRSACMGPSPELPVSFVLHQAQAPVAIWICP